MPSSHSGRRTDLAVSALPMQCPTGTRYPTRTRSFSQYPICTRFVLKIIGYFGYRVFQNTMFLTWKTASRSNKVLTNIIFIWKIHYNNVSCANFNGILLHNSITPVFLWVLHICYYGKRFRYHIEARLSRKEG